VLVFFFFSDFAGTGRAGFHPAALVFAAVWIGPFVLHAAAVRTAVGTAFGGVVLLAATGGFLFAIFDSESSTAAIGLVTVPLGGTYPLAFALLGLDRMVEAWEHDDWPRLRAHLTALSIIASVFAGLFAITALAKLMNTTESDHPLPLAGAAAGTAVATSSLVIRTLLGRRTPTPVR